VEEMIDFDTSQYEQFWKPGPKKGAFTKKRLKKSGCLCTSEILRMMIHLFQVPSTG